MSLNRFPFLIALLGLFTFSACTEDEEKIAPQINNLSVNDSATDLVLWHGEPSVIKGSFSDNKKLKRLNLMIRRNEVTTFQTSFQLGGKNADFEGTFTTPASAGSGEGVLVAQLEDQAGNTSEVILEINVGDGSPLILNALGQPYSGPMSGETSSTFVLQGMVKDNKDLNLVAIRLFSYQQGSGPEEIFSDSYPFPGSNDTHWDMNGGIEINIPANALRLYYKLVISAFDRQGNSTFERINFYIQP